MKMNIGIAIKRIRTEKGISQSDFAQKIGLSQTSLSLIENGVKRPSAKNLAKICESLEVPEQILYLYNLKVEDVPASKQELYKMLFPVVEDLITKLIH